MRADEYRVRTIVSKAVLADDGGNAELSLGGAFPGALVRIVVDVREGANLPRPIPGIVTKLSMGVMQLLQGSVPARELRQFIWGCEWNPAVGVQLFVKTRADAHVQVFAQIEEETQRYGHIGTEYGEPLRR